ncbi:MAG TPA: hypothetical protein VMU46_08710 [Burkholderiales bacterium]|nr:hypothetical protein [Burkholderiales bacterium]
MTGGEPGGAPLFRLVLSPSPRFAAVILIIHLTAAGCCLAVSEGWPGIALALLLTALGGAAARDRALLRGARAARAIEIFGSGEARLALADGETIALEPVRGMGVTRYWVALRCGAPGRRGILVTAGMLGAAPLRRLRLWALWGKAAGVAGRQLPA